MLLRKASMIVFQMRVQLPEQNLLRVLQNSRVHGLNR